MIRKQIMQAVLCLTMIMVLLISCAQFASAATPDQVKDKQLRLGGKGTYVTWFQKRLKALGYYEGGLTNVYNRRTQKATKSFQLANQLKQTGNGDKLTRETAFSNSAVTQGQYDREHFIIELKPGTSGEQVVQYQERLKLYGYLEVISGIFDDETKRATLFFQSAHKLATTGIATRATRNLINKDSGVTGYDAYEAAQSTAGFKTKNEFGLAVMQVQERLTELGYYKDEINGYNTTKLNNAVVTFKKFNNFKTATSVVSAADRAIINAQAALSYEAVYGPDTLKPGDKGQTVLAVQVILRELKCYKGPLNGQYGKQMTAAVKRFQKAKKLYPTGYLFSTSMALLSGYLQQVGEVNVNAYVAIDVAKSLIGKPYKQRAAGPDAFDCSGLTRYVFKKAGMTLAQSAVAQSKRGKLVVSRTDLLPGDLVFFATGSNKNNLNHVGIVTDVDGDNAKFIHASSSGRKVIASTLKDDENGDFYNKRFLWARRMW